MAYRMTPGSVAHHSASRNTFQAVEAALGRPLSEDARLALPALLEGIRRSHDDWRAIGRNRNVRARVASVAKTLDAALKTIRDIQAMSGGADARCAAVHIKFAYAIASGQARTDFNPLIEELSSLLAAARTAEADLQRENAKRLPGVVHAHVGRLHAFFVEFINPRASGKPSGPFARFCEAAFEELQLKGVSLGSIGYAVENYFKARKKAGKSPLQKSRDLPCEGL